MITFAALFLSLNSFGEEFFLLKQDIHGPDGYNTTKHFMGGNNELGFFYRKSNDNEGICRIRFSLKCDYGNNFKKELKNTKLSLVMKFGSANSKSDHSGTVDLLFRCKAISGESKAQIVVGKHISEHTLNQFPKEIVIPERDCR